MLCVGNRQTSGVRNLRNAARTELVHGIIRFPLIFNKPVIIQTVLAGRCLPVIRHKGMR